MLSTSAKKFLSFGQIFSPYDKKLIVEIKKNVEINIWIEAPEEFLGLKNLEGLIKISYWIIWNIYGGGAGIWTPERKDTDVGYFISALNLQL